MTADQAIAISQDLIADPGFARLNPIEKDAIKLGSEGLKQVKDCRSGEVLNPDFLLPGESKVPLTREPL